VIDVWILSRQCFHTVGWATEGHPACKKTWMLVCRWWHFDWSFARIAPVVATTSITLAPVKSLSVLTVIFQVNLG